MFRLTFIRTAVLAACLSAMGASTAFGQNDTQDKPFQPEVGQAGKDVVWVPTPDATVETMLDMAKVTPNDFLIDLGSGDGKTVIAAARRGVRAHGVEFNPDMVALARRRASEAGVSNLATFQEGDLFEADLSKATVITLFLLPDLNLRLRPFLLDLKPGTRIVSNSFTMGEWEEDRSERVTENCTSWCNALLWIIPAKVDGQWTIGGETLTLTQTFQQFSGTLGTSPISNGSLNGDAITFEVGNRTFTGTVSGNTMHGTIRGGSGGTFLAARQGSPAAPSLRTASAGESYTVKEGDTLSAISRHFYGAASRYLKIFEANRDQLTDPDRIRVGQVLKVPPA